MIELPNIILRKNTKNSQAYLRQRVDYWIFENVAKRVRLELVWNWIRIMKPVDVIYLLFSFNNADSTNRDYYYLSSRILFQIYTQYPPIKLLIKFSLSICIRISTS